MDGLPDVDGLPVTLSPEVAVQSWLQVVDAFAADAPAADAPSADAFAASVDVPSVDSMRKISL